MQLVIDRLRHDSFRQATSGVKPTGRSSAAATALNRARLQDLATSVARRDLAAKSTHAWQFLGIFSCKSSCWRYAGDCPCGDKWKPLYRSQDRRNFVMHATPPAGAVVSEVPPSVPAAAVDASTSNSSSSSSPPAPRSGQAPIPPSAPAGAKPDAPAHSGVSQRKVAANRANAQKRTHRAGRRRLARRR